MNRNYIREKAKSAFCPNTPNKFLRHPPNFDNLIFAQGEILTLETFIYNWQNQSNFANTLQINKITL